MYQGGLVLEGGGMKGVYTSGVLDLFLDKGIAFSSVYGVSAGACSMCSFLSGQRGRARDVSIDYVGMKQYCSVQSLLTTGDLFNVQMCYHLIPEALNPYDYAAFDRYEGRAYSVVTNLETGKAEYLRIRDMDADIDKIRASASLPLVSRNVKIDGKYYLDGGISDSIPLKKSQADGNQKNVVIMTKEEGYIRRPSGNLGLIRLRYLRYPKVYELMSQRHIYYNATVRYIEDQAAKGEIFLIRPKKASNVGRIEKDAQKLQALYEEGYRDAQDCLEELIQYLEA